MLKIKFTYQYFENNSFRKTARNFNAPMGKAAKFTIAEVIDSHIYTHIMFTCSLFIVKPLFLYPRPQENISKRAI